MKFFNRKKEVEERADVTQAAEALLTALSGTDTTASKQIALQIPTVAGAINKISTKIATLPIKLYRRTANGVVEIKDDVRLRLLNSDTNDTLTATQMWQSVIIDYLLGKGGYIYIDKQKGKFNALKYTNEECVSTYSTVHVDAINKSGKINVQGKEYQPYQFIKLLQNTKDGLEGKSILQNQQTMLMIAYYYLKFEFNFTKRGGRKKGFLQTENVVDEGILASLKQAWTNLYTSDNDDAVVLQKGLKFQAVTDTFKDLELSLQKQLNSTELSMLFNVPNSILRGNATTDDKAMYISDCLIPIINNIECSLDRDLLLEKEKDTYYFTIDTRELTRGDVVERYNAYSTAIKTGFLSPNEVREMEDKPQIEGLDIITLSLGNVMYDIKTKQYFVPNTGESADLSKNVVKEGEK